MPRQSGYGIVGNDNPFIWDTSRDWLPGGIHGTKRVEARIKFGDKIFSKTKDFELFFKKRYDEDLDGLPNWYEYWSNDGAVTNNNYGDLSARWVYGGDAGAGNWGATRVTTDVTTLYQAAADSCDVGNYARNNGIYGTFNININHQGIDCLALTACHEKGHTTVYGNWLVGGAWAGMADLDCDSIPDNVENGLAGFRNNSATSFPDYPVGDSPGYNAHNQVGLAPHACNGTAGSNWDEEIYLDYMCRNQRAASATNDWANPGKQSNPAYRRIVIESGTNVSFNGTFSEYGVDTDGDSLYNFLTVVAGVNVSSAGTYTLFGTIEDSNGYILTALNETFFLNTGGQELSINFDGLELRKRRVNGPYNLTQLTLFGNETQETKEDVSPSLSIP